MQHSKSPYERPLKHLNKFSKDFFMDAHWRNISDLYINSERNWPKWCFLPSDPHLEYYFKTQFVIPYLDSMDKYDDLMEDGVPFFIFCNWRYTQSVYRIDEALLQELYKVDMPNLPTKLLLNLREGCFYIETPGLEFMGAKQYGVFVFLDYVEGRTMLRVLIDMGQALQRLEININDCSFEENLREVEQNNIEKYGPGAANEELCRVAREALKQTLNILQYICSDSAEFLGNERPKSIQLKKVKKGIRLFPPKRPKTWYLGHETGKQIKVAQEAVARGDKTLMPHIRRAHWHSYWTGPMKGERKLIVKFLAPIIVGAEA